MKQKVLFDSFEENRKTKYVSPKCNIIYDSRDVLDASPGTESWGPNWKPENDFGNNGDL